MNFAKSSRLTPYPLSALEFDFETICVGEEGDEFSRGMGALRAPIPLENSPLPLATAPRGEVAFTARGRARVGVRANPLSRGSQRGGRAAAGGTYDRR